MTRIPMSLRKPDMSQYDYLVDGGSPGQGVLSQSDVTTPESSDPLAGYGTFGADKYMDPTLAILEQSMAPGQGSQQSYDIGES